MKNILQKIAHKKNPIILVAGFGGSGKTTFCNTLKHQLSNAVVLATDWFATETEVRKKQIENARKSQDILIIQKEENPFYWYDWNSFSHSLRHLQDKRFVVIQNAWNQKTGKKDLQIPIALENDDTAIICEGIYTLDSRIDFPKTDLKIWLDVNPEILLENIVQRDHHRNNAEYLQQKHKWFLKYELPLRQSFIKNANIVIDNNDFQNPQIVTKK